MGLMLVNLWELLNRKFANKISGRHGIQESWKSRQQETKVPSEIRILVSMKQCGLAIKKNGSLENLEARCQLDSGSMRMNKDDALATGEQLALVSR